MSAKYTFLAWETKINNPPLKLALLQLANNADDDGFSFYSIKKMSVACGMSERTFMRKIIELEEMNVLTVERRKNRPSLYTLSGDEMGVTLCHLHNSEVTECHDGVTECHGVGDRVSHDLNSTPNTYPNPCTSDNKKQLKNIEDGFNHWWDNYPTARRKNKAGCLKKFKAKTKNLSRDEFDELVNNICTDIKTRIELAEDVKYIPMTEPYLNQERWRDGE